MPLPPKKPINYNGIQCSYFQFLLMTVGKSIPQKEFQINFDGFDELVEAYESLDAQDFDLAWRIAQECNAWSEYISDCIANIHAFYRDAEVNKMSAIALASTEADVKNVSNGERLANKDARVIEARKLRNHLEALEQALEAKKAFIERAFYFCKSTCDWAKFSRNEK